jgi:flagellar assembly factor FliW
MPSFDTVRFGSISYEEEAVIEFPAGLPAFEEERRFVLIEPPATAPVVFLQSLSRPDLSFITLPAQTIDSDYALCGATEDLKLIGLEAGADAVCLAIVTVPEDGAATANLLAPVVINPRTRRAVQVIQIDSGYSHQHVLEAACC